MTTTELVEANIMLTRGLMPWGQQLVETAELVGGWTKSSTYNGEKDLLRTSQGMMISRHIDQRFIPFENAFELVVAELLEVWKAENPFAVLGHTGNVSVDEGFSLLKYTVGQRYGIHTDAAVRRDPSVRDRQISIIAFPTANVQGGELYFPRQRLYIKPEAGLVVSFPSNTGYPHESLAVWSGTKYSLVTWLY
jgi:hypothetical protein